MSPNDIYDLKYYNSQCSTCLTVFYSSFRRYRHWLCSYYDEQQPLRKHEVRQALCRKLTKKEPKSVPKQLPPQPKNSKSNEFDDLLDDLLEKDAKPAAKPVENKSVAQLNKNKYNDLDSYFDEPKSVSLDKTKQMSPKINPVNNSFAKTSIFKNESID